MLSLLFCFVEMLGHWTQIHMIALQVLVDTESSTYLTGSHQVILMPLELKWEHRYLSGPYLLSFCSSCLWIENSPMSSSVCASGCHSLREGEPPWVFNPLRFKYNVKCWKWTFPFIATLATCASWRWQQHGSLSLECLHLCRLKTSI